MDRLIRNLPLSLLLTALGLPMAHAAKADIMSDCRGDYLRHCAATPPGDGRIARCLASRRSELSPACARSLSAANQCRPEIERWCRQSSSPAAMKGCLEARRSELSADCRASLGAF